MAKTDHNVLKALLLMAVLVTLAVVIGAGPLIRYLGVPRLAWLFGLTFVIQWAVFIPAWLSHSEKYFDLTGSLTFIFITTLALFSSDQVDGRAVLAWCLVLIWAVRLGLFLFLRVQRSGKDVRFDRIKTSFSSFLLVWTLQGLWIAVTLSAALVTITTSNRPPFDFLAAAGLLIWAAGFAIEVAADMQKSRFHGQPRNHGKFIQSGLWSRSRHPNYFGEIVLWTGMAVIALPVLKGLSWLALISPVFVTLLLTRISGVPLLERKADAAWGGEPEYESYKERTPVLIPRL